jgi:hypothetical protein
MPAGNVLFPAPLYESGLKPSLATTTAKASDRVIADPLGWEDGRRKTWPTPCSTYEAEHEVFPRPPIFYVLTHLTFLAGNFALTKANLSDGVDRQTRLKWYMHQRGGTQDVFRQPCGMDAALAGNPAFPHLTARALVWPTNITR